MAKKVIRFSKKDLQIIKDFIGAIDNTIKVEYSDLKRFECDIPAKIVYIGTKTIDKEDKKLFLKWFQKQPEYININKRLMSILHEIGHIQTFDELEYEERNQKEEILVNMYEQELISFEKLNFSYWDIPNERKATMWGVDFYKSHKKECGNLIKKLKLRKYC